MNLSYLESISNAKDIKVFTPKNLSETEEIILYLKNNSLILNLKSLKNNDSQRILDMLLGAVCALDKHVCVLDNFNYLFL